MLFSTDTGDAWLLDRSDRLAARVARNGETEPVHIGVTAIKRQDRGEPVRDIARSYNVHNSTISRLVA